MIVILMAAAQALAADAGAVLHEMPSAVDAQARYLIYLHARIVEEQGAQPMDPRFGVYDIEGIVRALAEPGLQVLSEIRPHNADPLEYAERTAAQVLSLIAAGVPPSHITIVGVSKGGAIAVLVAALLRSDQVRFVLLATCSDEILSDPDLAIAGRVLSIYEATDDLCASCRPLFERSPGHSTFDEICLETGLAHGEFYTPRDEWVDPTVLWALGGD